MKLSTVGALFQSMVMVFLSWINELVWFLILKDAVRCKTKGKKTVVLG